MATKSKANLKVNSKIKDLDSIIEKIGIYDRSDKNLEKLEAVKQGLFTIHEMRGVLDCYRDDCQLIFLVLDTLTKSSEERIERIQSFKTHFQLRYDMNEGGTMYWHYHSKLMKFLDSKLWEEQKKVLLEMQTPLKTAKSNKDLLLNQEQLVVLFQFLQKINIFDNTQKLNTKMAYAINLLTGWDKDKTRNLFSDNNDLIHKKKVIQAMKLLITELEK